MNEIPKRSGAQDSFLLQHLNRILSHTRQYFESSNPQTWIVLGGSGFIGRWISLFGQFVNTTGLCKVDVVIVSRNRSTAIKRVEDFFPKNTLLPRIENYTDIFDSNFLKSLSKENTTIFHSATTSEPNKRSLGINSSDLNIFPRFIAKLDQPNLIHLSSGAVYNYSVDKSQAVSETIAIHDVQTTNDPYVLRKLEIENLVNSASISGLAKSVNARLFTHAGPGLSLDNHFAITSFIRMALSGDEIVVKGSPETVRSYMSPYDLVLWLVKILENIRNLNGMNLNVGSGQPISMRELAHLVKRIFSAQEVQIDNTQNLAPTYYFPNTNLIAGKITAPPITPLEEVMLDWKAYIHGPH